MSAWKATASTPLRSWLTAIWTRSASVSATKPSLFISRISACVFSRLASVARRMRSFSRATRIRP